MANFSRRKKNGVLTLTLLLCAAVYVFLNLNYELKESPSKLYALPGPELKNFTFGYDEIIADTTWLQALQNFTTCEQDRGGSSYSPTGARMGLDRIPACSHSRLFYLLNLVLELAPRFKFVAEVGPTVLSVVVDDIDGASELFLKAIRLYPNNWIILSRAGSHFALEVEDRSLAAQLFIRAVENSAPTWMALYASKLWEKDGQKELGKRILMRFRNHDRLTERDRKYIEEKIGLDK